MYVTNCWITYRWLYMLTRNMCDITCQELISCPSLSENHEIKSQDMVYDGYGFPICHRKLLLSHRSTVYWPPYFPRGWAASLLLRQWPIIEPFCMYTVNHCSGRIPCSPHTFLPTFGMWEHWWCIWRPDRKVALSEVLLLNSRGGAGNRKRERKRWGEQWVIREIEKENDDQEETKLIILPAVFLNMGNLTG